VKVSNVLVLPDLHLPVEDRESLSAVERYMGDHEWSEVIQIGDFLDMDSISSHNKEKLRVTEGQRIQKDFDYANDVLDRWARILGDTKITIEGNHDYRVERLIDASPVLEGLVEIPKALRFAERGISWVPYWSKGAIYKVGKANFIHGRYTNKYHAAKHVAEYGGNVFYGHVHDCQMHSIEHLGDNETRVGQSLGCLCRYDLKWLRGAPNKWQQAFGVFRFLDDGFFSYSVVRIFDHRFVSPEGRVYQGRKRT